MGICHPDVDWSCRWSDDELAQMRADPVEAAKLEKAEAFAWSTLASLTAYQIGTCPITVRPCAASCRTADGMMVAPVGSIPSAVIGRPMAPYISGGLWYNACGCSLTDCSCSALSEAVLPGPVGSIVEVVVDGVTLSRSEYRVDNGNRLVRLGGESWPACQDMSAMEGEGTFFVTYYRGATPNLMTRAAAGRLASEFYDACEGRPCKLPWNVVSSSRQGESYEYGEGGLEGVADAIPEVAAVVNIYNPHGLKTRPRVVAPGQKRARVTSWRG